ncbi:MAG: class I SAM-dependent methyltransferase [Negativicutes bacterium]|nr:class I SAM-dependent methyltransferase [Negativicutes bacterium]
MELSVCRPGGLTLTRWGVAACQFPPAASLCDIGCGTGATVALLKELGYQAIGVDLLPAAGAVEADAAALPFAHSSFDGLLFECSFSKITAPQTALGEARRVLKPGGKLLISDFYARGQAADFSGVLGRMESRPTLLQRFQAAGFALLSWQDQSAELPQFWGQWILERGSQQIYAKLDRTALRQAKCGYFLAILEASS